MKSYILLLVLIVAARGTLEGNSEELNLEKRAKSIREWNEEQAKANENKYRDDIISAIMFVESNNNALAYNNKEDAVGLLQIRKCVIDDLNSIMYGYKKYRYADRWNREKAIQMFWEYQSLWNDNINVESCSRIWNGGPHGESKSSTEDYYTKVLYKFLVS